MRIVAVAEEHVAALAASRLALWPDGTLGEHTAEVRALVEGRPRSTLPLTAFVAEVEGALVGFVEVGLRSHADGCDPRRPVGYIEGWYVDPAHARQGIGRALIARAEGWAREQGAEEMASDTWVDNAAGQAAHEALGYEVVDRCVNYRKRL